MVKKNNMGSHLTFLCISTTLTFLMKTYDVTKDTCLDRIQSSVCFEDKHHAVCN